MRDVRDVEHRAVENPLVRLARPRRAGQLAHELQRRVVDLLVRRRRLEIRQHLDVAAHARLSRKSPPQYKPPSRTRQRRPLEEASGRRGVALSCGYGYTPASYTALPSSSM